MNVGFAMGQDIDPDGKEIRKTGLTFVPLPIFSYDADMGFQFGALTNLYYWGDGSTYPAYRHSLYAEASWYTKGTSVYQLFYDSKYLLPWNIRITADFSYITEKALNFYGFNGYQAAYHHDFEDDESDAYVSRVFYRMERKMFRSMIDLQGDLLGSDFRWLAGVTYFNHKTGTVDIDKINEGKKEENQLPDTTLLYDYYVRWGLIDAQEGDGGGTLFLKLGLIYDSRDNEPAPNRGIWSELLWLTGPNWSGNRATVLNKLVVTHRQYIPLINKKLILAYRASLQTFIGEKAPYYLLPYQYSSFTRSNKPDGLGGARTLRGVLRNRIVGDGMALGNIELRWKFFRTVFLKQNFYFALYGFADAGRVVVEREVDGSLVPEEALKSGSLFDQDHDSLHGSIGLGLRIGLNENFLILFDYGHTLDRRDGISGFYLGVGNNF